MKKITLLITLFICISMNAQWTSDTAVNTLVADSDSDDAKSIATSDGQTYVVFWKVVPAPTNYELRVQLLDEDGNKQYGNDGMLISDEIPMSTFTNVWSITIDANDNLYVGVTGSGDDSGHAYKLDIAGNQLWGTNGIDLGIPGYVVTILPLESGDALISWFPFDTALVQKYDTNGDSVWASAQDVGTGVTAPANMYELSDGGHISFFILLDQESTLHYLHRDTILMVLLNGHRQRNYQIERHHSIDPIVAFKMETIFITDISLHPPTVLIPICNV